jgi:hypothetical protein
MGGSRSPVVLLRVSLRNLGPCAIGANKIDHAKNAGILMQLTSG